MRTNTREWNSEAELWHFLPYEPSPIEVDFKRSNLIVIVLLLFLVLGAFAAGFGSEEMHNSTATGGSPHATQRVVHHG